jgi:hypothetical protein
MEPAGNAKDDDREDEQITLEQFALTCLAEAHEDGVDLGAIANLPKEKLGEQHFGWALYIRNRFIYPQYEEIAKIIKLDGDTRYMLEPDSMSRKMVAIWHAYLNKRWPGNI